MTKSQLVDAVAARTGLTKKQSAEAIDAALDTVEAVLGRSARKATLSEAQLLAFMQAVNGVRLVLGTMLDVQEDDDMLDPDDDPEHHLYAYLSWLLDSTVRALSGA